MNRLVWMSVGMVLGLVSTLGTLFIIVRGVIRWFSGYEPPPAVPLSVMLRRWSFRVAMKWHQFRAEIRKARNPGKRKRIADGPADGEVVDVIVPVSAGPLVESTVSKSPLLLTQVPARSTKADAKRVALDYARKRTRNPTLTWKRARQLMNQWGREERDQERMAPEYAVKMRELTEASR